MKKEYIYILLLLICLTSCDKWLDNKPYDRVDGNELYSSEKGVQQALTGLYVGLINSDIYGGNLTISTLEVLAQHYIIADKGHRYWNASQYNYAEIKSTINAIWSGLYKQIADCNIFLEQIEKNKAAYNEENYKLYRGEVLALRTLLYLDVFRLFGPMHADDPNTMENRFVPYYPEYTQLPAEYMKGLDYIQRLHQDLDEAIELLRKDPILNHTDGIYKAEGDFWAYRNFRMNLFAAQALKARMCLHTGDRDNAYIIASSLLEGRDPFTQAANNFESIFKPIVSITNAYERDPVYFSEMLFCLQNINRDLLQRNYFSLDLHDNEILLGGKEYMDALFTTQADVRGSMYSDAPSKGGNNAVSSFFKYVVRNLLPADTDIYRFDILPMIRLGELYLIAAETSDNDTDKKKWLEKLRRNRGFLQDNTAGMNLDQLINDEYNREFYLEGQYYYYLKRNKVGQIKSQTGVTVTMGRDKYEMPLPDDEVNRRLKN